MSEKQPADSPGIADVSRFNRSRITNGSHLHGPGVNGRTAEARRWKDLFMQFLTNSTRAPGLAGEHLARRAATLAVQLERMDAASARGENVNIDDVTRLTNSFQRVLEALGLTTPPEPENVDPAEHAKKIRDPNFWRNRK